MGLFSKKKNEEVAIDELTPQIKTKLDERKVDVMVSYISNLSSIGETYAIDTHINILKDKFKRKCIKNSCMNLITEILENKDIDLVMRSLSGLS